MICLIVSGGRLFRASLYYDMHQTTLKSSTQRGLECYLLLFFQVRGVDPRRRTVDQGEDDRPNLLSCRVAWGGNARWAVGKVTRGGNGRFRAEVAGDLPVG